MLIIYIPLARTTRTMVVFGTKEEAILYLPKEIWVVMGRPKRVALEISPDEEE